ncbi:tail fiber domain-containing protein [Porticoccaceae bacterium]|nr:tail fiber domain-containing protein [Porticoccaceae bacterium]
MSFIPYPRNYRNGSVVIDNAQIGTNTKTLNGNTDQYFDKSIELNRTYGGYKKYWMGMIGEGNKTSVGGVPNDNNSFGICVDNGSVAEPEVLLELNKDGDLRIRGDIYIAGEVINVTNEHIQVEDISSNTYKFNGSESSIYKDNNDIVINNEQGDIRLSAGNVTMHGALNVEGYILDINRNDNNTTSLIRAGKNGSTNGQLVIQHDRRIVFDKLSDSSNPNVEINTQTGELRCTSLIVENNPTTRLAPVFTTEGRIQITNLNNCISMMSDGGTFIEGVTNIVAGDGTTAAVRQFWMGTNTDTTEQQGQYRDFTISSTQKDIVLQAVNGDVRVSHSDLFVNGRISSNTYKFNGSESSIYKDNNDIVINNLDQGDIRLSAGNVIIPTGDLSVTGNSTVDGNLTVNQFFRVGNTSQPDSDIVLFSNSPGDESQSRFVTEGKKLFIQNNTSINFGSIGTAGVVSINTTNGNLSVTGTIESSSDISSNTYKFNSSESSIYKDNNDIVINNLDQGDIRLSAGNVTMLGELDVEGYILDINRNDNNTTSLIRAGKNGSTNGQLVIQHDRRIVFDKLSDSSKPNVEINTQTGELRCASLIVDSTGDLSVTGNSTVDGNLSVAGTVSSSSDIRLKENITNLNNSLDKISNIRGVNYNLKNDETKTKTAGVIAQELLEQIPEAVNDSDSEHLRVNYNAIIPYLIESVKELKREIDDLKANNI